MRLYTLLTTTPKNLNKSTECYFLRSSRVSKSNFAQSEIILFIEKADKNITYTYLNNGSSFSRRAIDSLELSPLLTGSLIY